MSAQTPWLTLSSLEHFAYCPRQAALLRDGVWADNHLTVAGTLGHERVDSLSRDHRRGVRVHHRVELSSESLHIFGISDAIEEESDGTLRPVEHKHGRGAGDLWPATVQVVAQALCLEEMRGVSIAEAAVFVTESRERVHVEVPEHRGRVIDLIEQAHDALDDGRTPPPVYVSRLCSSCSIQNACQPRGGQWL